MDENEVMQEQTFDETSEDLGLDDVFSDTVSEETTEEQPTESAPQEQTEQEEQSQETQETQVDNTINAKFLGREIPIPKQALADVSKALGVNELEAVTMLQKGMNYDRVLQNTQQEIGILDEYAKMAGMSRKDFIAQLSQQQKQLQIQTQMEQLRKQHPNADEDLLKQTAQTNVALQEKIQQDIAIRRAMEQKQMAQRMWIDFFKSHPEITDVQTIPQQVMQEVSMGKSPQDAYLTWENKSLKDQILKLQQQQKNKDRAAPSALSTGGEKEKDPFSDGWDSVF